MKLAHRWYEGQLGTPGKHLTLQSAWQLPLGRAWLSMALKNLLEGHGTPLQ